jgi:ribosomal protein S27E
MDKERKEYIPLKIKPTCPKCRLVNVIFDFDKPPMKCQYCGAELILQGEE